MNDPTLQNRVLERSNVGMGMLVINRASLDLPCVNELYKRLRNLEVNSLKRFVGLAAMEPGPFSIGLDPKELLLAAVYAQKRGKLSRFSKALLWNSQELAYLVADYRKPLVCHLGGVAQDAGAALACLASFSGAYEDSEICVRACRHGLVPMGGMTYLLASLPWHLGEFLALTGWTLRGYELVALDLVEHWLSPEALPFLELTSEKQLEVSEADAKLLLHEHSLPLPQEGDLFQTSNAEGEGFKRRYIPLINKIFRHESPLLIREALKLEQKSAQSESDYKFLEECLEGMDQASTKASWITLELIDNARKRRNDIKNKNDPKRPEADERRIREGCLPESLRKELWAQQCLLQGKKDLPEIIQRLHAACTHQEMPRQNAGDVTLAQDIQEATNFPKDFVFAVPEDRSEISLSQHPRLRRYHPDYDPVTGLDHDPDWMRQEAERWDPELFADERREAVEELLGDRDPSAFGLSRWVRVDRDHAH